MKRISHFGRLVTAAGVIAAVGAALGGCAGKVPAPVIERARPPVQAPAPAPAKPAPAAVAPAQPLPATKRYTVRKGDTLHAIALDLGVDYRDLIAWNRIENPDVIHVGQVLRLTPPEDAQALVSPVAVPGAADAKQVPAAQGATPAYKREPKGGKQAYSPQAWALARQADREHGPAAAAPAAVSSAAAPAAAAPAPVPAPAESAPSAADSGIEWSWPANGKVLNGFREPASKGVDIAGKPGDPVLAAAAGKVIYAGSNVRGYGNLVVVKHNDRYLSAYAHNRKILVRESQQVERGQKIAELGDSDADQPKLHFEIRLQSKPVDPLKYLPGRPQ